VNWKLCGFGLVCLILLGACGGASSPSTLTSTSTAVSAASASGVQVESAMVARDDGNGKPGESVTSFKPTDRTFHAVVKLDRLESGLKVKFSWVAIQAAGSKNQVLAEEEFTTLTATTLTGTITLPEDWPTGTYRFDVYVNDSLAKSVDFTVTA
jgi:hypothetical protein